MSDNQETSIQVKDVFQKSRYGAILRCSEIMIDSGRKDLAKQIFQTTHIDRNKLAELKAQNL